jgi:hypothetical protein
MTDIESLLRRGGIPSGWSEQEPSMQPGGRLALPKYDGSLDPVGAEELGCLLAEASRDAAVDVVVVWQDAEDLVLAHVVARELGVRVVRTFDADGLVGHHGDFPPNARALIVADTLRDPSVGRALEQLVRQQGGQVIAAAVLIDSRVAFSGLSTEISRYALVAMPEVTST